MKKFKKYLLTSLSIGLTGVTVGSVVASCSSDQTQENNNTSPAEESTGESRPLANNPDPASKDSLITQPEAPLTKEQNEYHTNLSAEIKKIFDANANLDYKNPDDQKNIDEQIAKYQDALNNGPWKETLTKIADLDKNNANSITSFAKIISAYYDSFKQKNLLPSEDEVRKLYDEIDISLGKDEDVSLGKDEIDPKQDLGFLALFYSDPKNVILLNQLDLLKMKANNTNKEDNNDFKILEITISDISSFWDMFWQSPNSNKNSVAFKVEFYYNYFIKKLNILSNDVTYNNIPVESTDESSLTNNPNPVSEDGLITEPVARL